MKKVRCDTHYDEFQEHTGLVRDKVVDKFRAKLGYETRSQA